MNNAAINNEKTTKIARSIVRSFVRSLYFVAFGVNELQIFAYIELMALLLKNR